MKTAAILLSLFFSFSVSAQIAYRNAVGSNNAGGGNNIVMTVPSGVQNGDLLIMQITVREVNSSGITTPAGWTLLREEVSTTALKQAIYYKIAASEPSSYTVTLFNVKASGTIVALSGANINQFNTAIGAGNNYWQDISVNSSNGDVYACDWNGNINKQSGGSGSFIALSAVNTDWLSVSVNSSNGDVYACDWNGDIYKQSGGSGSFTALGETNHSWFGVSVNSNNGDVYACVSSGDIYKQSGGSGSFTALGAGDRGWSDIYVNSSNGDVYACAAGGDIYKQSGGSGSFTALGAGDRNWQGISVNTNNGDVYACADVGDIYKQSGGSGSFTALGAGYRRWRGISVNSSNGDVYACDYTGDIYKFLPTSFTNSGKVNASSSTITADALPTFSSSNGIDLFFGGTAVGTTVNQPPANYTNAAQSASTGGSAASRSTSNVAYRSLSNVTTVGSLTETMNASGVNIGHHLFIQEGTTTPPTPKPRKVYIIQ